MLPIIISILFASTTIASDPKSVNVQLEASIQLDPGDFFKNTNILRTANDFIKNIKKSFEPRATNDDEFNVETTEKPQEAKVLSKFVLDLGTELLNYKEDILKELAEILHNEANEYFRRSPYKPNGFNEKVSKFVVKKLKDLADSDPAVLKLKTRRFASNPNEETSLAVVEKLDKFFGENDAKTLNDIIEKLHFASKTRDRVKISKTIRDALQFLIVDRYELMNDSEKEHFRNEVSKIVDGKPASASGNGDYVMALLKNVLDESLKHYIESIFSDSADTTEKEKKKGGNKVKVEINLLPKDLDKDNEINEPAAQRNPFNK